MKTTMNDQLGFMLTLRRVQCDLAARMEQENDGPLVRVARENIAIIDSIVAVLARESAAEAGQEKEKPLTIKGLNEFLSRVVADLDAAAPAQSPVAPAPGSCPAGVPLTGSNDPVTP